MKVTVTTTPQSVFNLLTESEQDATDGKTYTVILQNNSTVDIYVENGNIADASSTDSVKIPSDGTLSFPGSSLKLLSVVVASGTEDLHLLPVVANVT